MPAVDEVLQRVSQVAERPVSEHVEVFERAHEQLRRALDARRMPHRPTTAIRAPEATVPPRRLRLDQELVRRGLARSREHASELIAGGRVTVSGAVATKPATGVTTDVAIVVREDPDTVDYVSRGGHKLAGALGGLRRPRALRGGQALPRRRRVDGRVHRRPAARGCPRGGGGRRRLRPAGVVAAAATTGWSSTTAPTSASSPWTSSASPSTSWWATCRSSRSGWCSTR